VLDSLEDAVKKAREIAEVIVAKSPIAVYGTKALLDYSRDHTIREGLEYTQLWNSIYLQTLVTSFQSRLTLGYQRSNWFLPREAKATVLKTVVTGLCTCKGRISTIRSIPHYPYYIHYPVSLYINSTCDIIT
jgi:hypothetical protein